MYAGKINGVFDVASTRPVEKREILEYFSLEYGLKYEISQSLNYHTPTGEKNIYYSNYSNAVFIGYSSGIPFYRYYQTGIKIYFN